jgi:hypothetical protein
MRQQESACAKFDFPAVYLCHVCCVCGRNMGMAAAAVAAAAQLVTTSGTDKFAKSDRKFGGGTDLPNQIVSFGKRSCNAWLTGLYRSGMASDNLSAPPHGDAIWRLPRARARAPPCVTISLPTLPVWLRPSAPPCQQRPAAGGTVAHLHNAQ